MLRILITGSNSGLGKESARQILQRRNNIELILTSRILSNAILTKENLLEEFPNVPTDRIHCYELDLSSFDSIYQFIQDFSNSFNSLDILMNNAGLYSNSNRSIQFTSEQFEPHFGIMMIGHAFLTRELIKFLRKSKQSPRIIWISAWGHKFAILNNNDFIDECSPFRQLNYYSSYQYYIKSKLAQLLYSKEFYEREKLYIETNENSKISTICIHPGVIRDTKFTWKIKYFFKIYNTNLFCFYRIGCKITSRNCIK